MNVLEARRRILGADVQKKTAEGNPISARSLARMRPGMKLYGKSTQQTTTGAQLVNIPDDYAGESNGITWSANGGVIHVSGTATSDVFTTNVDITDLIEPGQDYYISDNINDAPIFAYLEAHYTDETPNDYSQNKVYTAKPNIEKVIFYINVSAGATVDADVYPMLNTGSTAKPWEPYTGGEASPNPDYPQEIVSAGDDGSIQVDVGGRNLFDISQCYSFTQNTYGLSCERQDDYIVISGTANPPESLNNVVAFRTCNSPEDLYGKYFYVYIEESQNIDFNYGARCYSDKGDYDINISFKINSNNTYTYLKFKLMVTDEPGTFPYEPYKQPQTLAVQTPNGLPGIPVTSGGNYTDSDGQQWICDEIDLKRGKYVQRVSKVVVDGVNVKFEDKNNSFWNLPDFTAPGITQAVGVPYSSNYFPEYIFAGNLIYDFIFTMDENINPYFSSDDELNAFCAEKYTDGQPLEIYYPMDPIETDLSEEQMYAYASLHTNRPTTVVSATDDAGLELTYKTKKSLEVKD